MYQDVLNFWFQELEPKDWWIKSQKLDQRIQSRFGDMLAQASRNEFFLWRKQASSALAEVILLDQFSRNVFRDDPRAFQSDALALACAIGAVDKGLDKELSPHERNFLYMPYMHSESPIVHDEAVRLFTSLGNDITLDFEYKHKAIIDRFGRYPHRNKILGRTSTPEELAFLQEPGSSF